MVPCFDIKSDGDGIDALFSMDAPHPPENDYPLVSSPSLRFWSSSSREHLFARVPGIDGLVYCCMSNDEELAVIGFEAVGIIQSPSVERRDQSIPYVIRRLGVAGEDNTSHWDKMMRVLAVSEGDLACRRSANVEIFKWSSNRDEPDLLIHRVRATKLQGGLRLTIYSQKSVFDGYPSFDLGFHRFPRIVVRDESGRNIFYSVRETLFIIFDGCV